MTTIRNAQKIEIAQKKLEAQQSGVRQKKVEAAKKLKTITDSEQERINNIVKVKFIGAEDYYDNQNFSAALTKIDEIEDLAGDNKSSTVQNLKVKALIGLKRFEKAKMELDKIYSMNPSNNILNDMARHATKIEDGIKMDAIKVAGKREVFDFIANQIGLSVRDGKISADFETMEIKLESKLSDGEKYTQILKLDQIESIKKNDIVSRWVDIVFKEELRKYFDVTILCNNKKDSDDLIFGLNRLIEILKSGKRPF